MPYSPLTGVLEHDGALGACSKCSFRRTPERLFRRMLASVALHSRRGPGAAVHRATTAGSEDIIQIGASQCDVPHNAFTEDTITLLRERLSFSFHSTKSVIISRGELAWLKNVAQLLR
jgi:hypothetical protein